MLTTRTPCFSPALLLAVAVAVAACSGDESPPPDQAEPPVDVVLANFDADAGCERPMYVFPLLPDEAGHLASARLTPESYPVVVTDVAYDLFAGTEGGAQCDTTLAHRVEIYVSDAASLTMHPSVDSLSARTLQVPGDAGAADQRAVTLALDPPVELAAGQHLFVAVALTASDDRARSLCIEACSDTGGTSGVNHWSNAAAEPYAWADMIDDFGFAADFGIRALGHQESR